MNLMRKQLKHLDDYLHKVMQQCNIYKRQLYVYHQEIISLSAVNIYTIFLHLKRNKNYLKNLKCFPPKRRILKAKK